jgi:hypothetical protein
MCRLYVPTKTHKTENIPSASDIVETCVGITIRNYGSRASGFKVEGTRGVEVDVEVEP